MACDLAHLFIDAEHHDISVCEARAAFAAEVLGVEPPSRLVDRDDCLAPEVIDFMRRTGVSLDFIFCGDLRGMLRVAAGERLREREGHA